MYSFRCEPYGVDFMLSSMSKEEFCERRLKGLGKESLCVRCLGKDPLEGRRCIVEGCSRKQRAKGMCAAHYARFVRRGGLQPTTLSEAPVAEEDLVKSEICL